MTWGFGLLLMAAAIAVGLLGMPALGVVLLVATVFTMLFVLTDRDPVTVLTMWAIVLFLIPARLVVEPLGAIGAPARLLGLGAMLWWLTSRLHPTIGGDHGHQPMRPVFLVFTWWLLLTYGVAQLRVLDPVEAASADRAAIVTVTLAGIALLAMDGISSRARLDVLVRRIVTLGGLVAIIGLLQVAGLDLVQMIRLPGLAINMELFTTVGVRGGIVRVTSTATHAIEFSVIMAVLLPLGLHVTFYGPGRRWTAGIWTLAMLLALPITVSRSSVVAFTVALLVLLWQWSWRRRLGFAALAVAAGVGLNTVVEGLFDTLRELFRDTDQDYSIQSRVGDWEQVWTLVRERPLFGRGVGTFEPDVYFFIDNEWLMIAITTGIVGVLLLLAVFGVAAGCCRGVRRRTTDPATAHLAQALLASVATFFVTFSLYDALSFSINAGLFALTMGLIGALWRLEVGSTFVMRDERGLLVGPAGPTPDTSPPRREAVDAGSLH